MVKAEGRPTACVFQGFGGKGLIMAMDKTAKVRRSVIKEQFEHVSRTVLVTQHLLELAEDVGILRRDARSLKDSDPKGKQVSNLEVLQIGFFQSRLQRTLFFHISCEEHIHTCSKCP